MIFDAYRASWMAGRNLALSMVKLISGAGSLAEAATRSSFIALRLRATTASIMVGIGMPRSMAFCEVHLPVPFWPALSRMTSTRGLPVSGSILLENVPGDFDQVGVERALVPFGEDLADFGGGHLEQHLHHEIGFADELHVAVLDAVVDHLHVMAGAVRAHPFAAGDVVVGADLGRDGLEDGLEFGPCGGWSRRA